MLKPNTKETPERPLKSPKGLGSSHGLVQQAFDRILSAQLSLFTDSLLAARTFFRMHRELVTSEEIPDCLRRSLIEVGSNADEMDEIGGQSALTEDFIKESRRAARVLALKWASEGHRAPRRVRRVYGIRA